ncbi:MAG: BatD family protein [Deltaproteobacteria bacterium]|nr:BatD family protein [Deltaproteobacteria bacterium]
MVGDSLNVEISVEGAGVRSPNVEMDDPPQFEIEGRSQGQQVSIVGGRTSMSRTLNLRYRAVKSGRAKFGPARVRYKGRVYQSNAVDVDVADSAAAAPSGPAPTEAAGKNAFLDVELTATEAYPGQEVGAAYFFYTSLNVRQAEAVSEPSFPGAIPHKLAGGGKLNFIGTRVGGESYLVSPLVRYVLYPVAPGEVTVDEFRMAALVDRPNKRRRGDVFDSFFATSAQRVDLASPRKIIKVKPLPAEGRPADFSGNVGVFTMSASLDKTSVDVGDAVTLSIVVEGKGNTETIAPPAVDVADGLKTFSQSSRDESVAAFDTMKSRRVFETIIVPEKSGVYDIGPFDMPVFDPDEEEYVRVTAPAVRFEAAPGSGPTMAAKKRRRQIGDRAVRQGHPHRQTRRRPAGRDAAPRRPRSVFVARHLRGAAGFRGAFMAGPHARAPRVRRHARAPRESRQRSAPPARRGAQAG